jgi:ribosomal protein S18 acetylase RimI-like enzyme
MNNSNLLDIGFTTDDKVISACALMMATSDPWITLGMKYEQCLTAFEGPCKEVYMAEYKKELAGFIIIQVCGTFKGYIQTVCVSRDFRGQGFGKQLLSFAEERILKISPNIFICVSSFNKGAVKLYYQLGFKLIGEFEHFLKQGFTELFLRKSVGPVLGYKAESDNE